MTRTSRFETQTLTNHGWRPTGSYETPREAVRECQPGQRVVRVPKDSTPLYWPGVLVVVGCLMVLVLLGAVLGWACGLLAGVLR